MRLHLPDQYFQFEPLGLQPILAQVQGGAFVAQKIKEVDHGETEQDDRVISDRPPDAAPNDPRIIQRIDRLHPGRRREDRSRKIERQIVQAAAVRKKTHAAEPTRERRRKTAHSYVLQTVKREQDIGGKT